MSVQIGYLDNNGHPRLTIRVTGTHQSACCDIEALVDTGFTGFLMLAIAQALPLGLALIGTGDYQLADGNIITSFLAKGTVTICPPSVAPGVAPGIPTASASLPGGPVTVIQPESIEGTIVLGGNGAILGMEFLRSLDKWLIVGKVVALFDATLFPVPQPSPSGPPPQATAADSN